MRSLSIVLCTFNGARFLGAQLRSLRNQAGVDEIVVVDDGSTDATLAILERHTAREPRLSVTVNPARLGVVRNFERAIRLAHGPWIALADQDDVWVPGKLAALRAAWDGESVLIHHATHKFSGAVPGALRSPAGERRKFSGGDVRRLLYRNSIVGHTTLVQADVVRRLMPFPAEVPHDWWIGAGAAVLGAVQYVDEYLVHYRIHGGNAYHRAGSRLSRMRCEHALRMQLLGELSRRPEVTGVVRAFVREYRERLQAAETAVVPWGLWQFYLRHAALLFGGQQEPLPWFTRLRKSFAATCGAVAQGGARALHDPRPSIARARQSHRIHSFSRIGLGACAAMMLALAGWRGSPAGAELRGDGAKARPAVDVEHAWSPGRGWPGRWPDAGPPLFLRRSLQGPALHRGPGFGPPEMGGGMAVAWGRFDHRPGGPGGLPPPARWAARRPVPGRGAVWGGPRPDAMSWVGPAGAARFHPFMLQRRPGPPPFGPPRPPPLPPWHGGPMRPDGRTGPDTNKPSETDNAPAMVLA